MYIALLPTLSLISAVYASVFDNPLLKERQLPANPTGVKTITSPGGVTVRYKEQSGLCEITPGVNSYTGYVDLDEENHMFFWFFEARHDAANAPLTVWLTGGPGGDSVGAIFIGLGPCTVTKNLTLQTNQYSWNEVSNVLFLSQPVGVGFSYAYEEEIAGQGRFAHQNTSTSANTTAEAAVVAWHVLQAFFSDLPQFDSQIKSRNFNLWTSSYGGHWGPGFFSYFEEQNTAIANGTQNGTQFVMDSLGIGNGIIDVGIQGPYWAEFTVNNTYGIKALNDTAYIAMKDAFYEPGMCRDQFAACAAVNRSSDTGRIVCRNAGKVCETYAFSFNHSRYGVFDIRHIKGNVALPVYYTEYLNQESVQQAIGVNLNYTPPAGSSAALVNVHNDFEYTGDLVYSFTDDIEYLLNNNVRVSLYHGDADYLCNWFGGEAVSLAINYTHSAQFRAAGYAPFVVDGVEYGSVRQYGNFSFTRIYEAGHGVINDQPFAMLELLRRVLTDKAISDGVTDVTRTYGTMGDANSTHTEPTPPSTTPTALTSAVTSAVTSGGQRRIHMFWRP